MPPLFLIHTRLLLHWGYMIHKPGTTAAKPAYILPPPTTVVGAYAAALAAAAGVPHRPIPKDALGPLEEFHYCLLHATLAAAAGLAPVSDAGGVGVAVYEELSRILGAPYKNPRTGSYSRALRAGPIYALYARPEVLPVQGLGAAYAPGALLDLAWLVDAERLAECLSGGNVAELLEAAAAGVYRVGSREGLASPLHWHVYRVEVREPGSLFQSSLPQPIRCAWHRRGSVARIALLRIPDYKEEEYLVPSMASGMGILLPPTCDGAVCGAYFEARSGCGVAVPEGGPSHLSLAFPRG